MQEYKVVYDASTEVLSEWALPAVLLVLVAVGLVVWRYPGLLGRPFEVIGRSVGAIFACVAALLFVIAATTLYMDNSRLRAALQTGSYRVVEGIVTDFVPGDPGDHFAESWSVRSGTSVHHYQYVASQATPGYRRTLPHGGQIRNGLRVRIAEVDGRIARLEIRR
ncbi:MAG TPA: hypothetical protein VGO40_13175 [Longimicrobium sp.]|jgi:hypothetical protein|nr:hypothetical protein [Longimicrobium sp.]